MVLDLLVKASAHTQMEEWLEMLLLELIRTILSVLITKQKHFSSWSRFHTKIDDTTIYAEKTYSPNFNVENKTFCLSLHYNGDNSYLFVIGKEVIKFKAKDSEIKAHPLCLRNISNKYLISSDFKDTALCGSIYNFSVDYSTITNEKILDIHSYLMKKNNII